MTHSAPKHRRPGSRRPSRSSTRRTPRGGARLLADVLPSGGRRDRATLGALELDWPGSRALLVRFAAALASAPDRSTRAALAAGLTAALAAYRAARLRGDRVAARFAAFVQALEGGVGRPGLVAGLLTPVQRTALAAPAAGADG